MNKNQILTILHKEIKKEKEVVFCYLFGSQAHGNVTSRSDIDVAAYLDPRVKDRFFDLRLALMEKLSRAFSKEVDVVILNTASPFLKYSVIKEGVLAYDHDSKQRVEFELMALNDYFDYKPILERYRKRLKISS